MRTPAPATNAAPAGADVPIGPRHPRPGVMGAGAHTVRPYSSTARPTEKNHRHFRPTVTPAAWDRARLYASSWGR